MDFYISVFLFAFSTSITPGPNTVMIMASGTNYGVKRSLPHLSGISFGFPVLVICVGLGLGSVFDLYPSAEKAMKIISILYLLYLAYMIGTSMPSAEGSNRNPLSFLQAASFQWINPKGWFVALSGVSAFVTSDGNFAYEIFVISFIFFFCAALSSLFWLIFGASFKGFINEPLRGKLFNMSMGILLVISIVPSVFELINQY